MTSGFEVVVRPMILPDIRPGPPRVLPATKDPTSGIATITGSGGSLIDLTFSESHSSSRSHAVEKKRTVDVERIYHKDDQGNVDKSQFIDTERVKKLVMDEAGVEKKYNYAKPPERDNVEILETDKVLIPEDTA